MAKLLEDSAKRLLRQYGVPVPDGEAVSSPKEALAAAERLSGRVVIKALIPAGKRGKAGAIRFADGPMEAGRLANELLNQSFYGFPVEGVLVEEALDIVQECFLSISYDGMLRQPVVLFSPTGGMDIESIVRGGGELVRFPFDPRVPIESYQGRQIARQGGIAGKQLQQMGALIARLSEVFLEKDLHLAEINPVAITATGGVVAAAAVLAVDDQALFRQPALAQNAIPGQEQVGRPLTPLEQEIRAIDETDPEQAAIRFMELDGDIGFMIMGGGGGLVALDTLTDLGGKPATYFDITAGDVEEKMYRATMAILRKPCLKGLVVGSNLTSFTQVDAKVRAVLRAVRDSGVDPNQFPVVIRLAGPGEDRARELLHDLPGVEYHGEDLNLEQLMEVIWKRVQGSGGKH